MTSDIGTRSLGAEDRDEILCLYVDELDALLTKASREGAIQALERLQLNDPQAAEDLQDMRSIVRDWRMVRTTMIKRLVNTVITVFLIAVAGMIAHFGFEIGGPT